jgi:short-subunit dehydrogenase
MSYTLITGGSSGIGLELAKLFAQDGKNLILIGRNQTKLEQAKYLIRSRNSYIEIQTFTCDLSKIDDLIGLYTHHIQDQFEIEILVNNAGFSNSGSQFQTDLQDEIKMLHTNIHALVVLTKLVLPQMVRRKKGKILNVASVAAFQPLPYQATYGGAKAFVLSYSQALRNELKGSGITVTTLCPGPVDTNFFDVAKITPTNLVKANMMAAEKVAQIGYQALRQNRGVVVTSWKFSLMSYVSKLLPSSLTAELAKKVIGVSKQRVDQ